MTETCCSLYVLWEDIHAALELLKVSASAPFETRPVGNHVVIDCEREADARLVEEAFRNCRRLSAPK
ncbi:MAG TPA: hypothetical protein VF499_09540 [Afipia sp.]